MKRTGRPAAIRIHGGGKKKRVVQRDSGFAKYQRRTAQTVHGRFKDQKGQIASMLGIASETGSILDSYKRYLRDSIDLILNREFLRIELGDLLWYVAVVATACELKLGNIARTNLKKARKRFKARIGCIVSPERTEPAEIVRDFSEYQFKASQFSKLDLGGPEGAIAPLCGLAKAAGEIFAYPKDDPDKFDLRANKKFFLTELGDLLWYVSAVATAFGINLGDIAVTNLERARDLYPIKDQKLLFRSLPKLDRKSLPREAFPRQLLIRFQESPSADGPTATQTLVYANPNRFPRGPVKARGKWQGYKLGRHLGNKTTDNSRRADGYRYHDAIHMGFMAVLGWSPTMRALLRLKRKSRRATDREEDGARAVYTEEGIAAILARFAQRRMRFQGENTVDGEIIATVKALVRDTEVEALPGWLWRRAISKGFVAMQRLDENKGGYLFVDLDARELSYSKVKPDVRSKKRFKNASRP